MDPAREFWNSYSYVGNNPIMGLDPSGKALFLFFWDASEHYEGDSGVGHVAIGVGTAESMIMFESNPVGRGLKAPMNPNFVYLGSMDSILKKSSPDHHGRPYPDLILEITNTTQKNDSDAINALFKFFKENKYWDLLDAHSVCSDAAVRGIEAAGFPLRQDPGLFSSPKELALKINANVTFENAPPRGIYPLMNIRTIHGDFDSFLQSDGSVLGAIKVNAQNLFEEYGQSFDLGSW